MDANNRGWGMPVKSVIQLGPLTSRFRLDELLHSENDLVRREVQSFVRGCVKAINDTRRPISERLHICRTLMHRGFGPSWSPSTSATVSDIAAVNKAFNEHPAFKVDLTRYPHECPRCGAPAYAGLTSVECSDGCG